METAFDVLVDGGTRRGTGSEGDRTPADRGFGGEATGGSGAGDRE